MKSRLRVMLGLTLYLACLWSLAMVIYFVFSVMLIGDPTYCHPRLRFYEVVFPARPLACLLADPGGEQGQPRGRFSNGGR
ncbi:MAG: hypothetical protein IIC64_08170 [SAR324 cluster bacterium]|nr:hypothetical protein [SAR324 cluster bacterium]